MFFSDGVPSKMVIKIQLNLQKRRKPHHLYRLSACSETEAPPILQEMTENIKDNGYSKNNAKKYDKGNEV